MNQRIRGMLFTIASALIFGLTPLLASQTYEMGSNAYSLTFYRNLLVVPILAVIMLVRRISFRLTKRELGAMLLVSVVFGGSTTFMLYEAYNYVGVGTATTLHFLYPVFVTLLCFLLFREKVGKVRLIALLLAVAGIACFLDRGGASWPGILLALASAVTYACYMTGMDKAGLKSMNTLKLTFYSALFNSVAFFLADIPFRQIVYTLPPRAMLYNLLIAVSVSIVAIGLLQWGVRDLGAGMASIFCMFEPIASVLGSWILLGEPMGLLKGTGCVVILGAVTILVAAGRSSGQDGTQDESPAPTKQQA